jgi:ankyrin repeat protein
MREPARAIRILLACSALLSMGAAPGAVAVVYQCRAADGSTTYSDIPCPADSTAQASPQVANAAPGSQSPAQGVAAPQIARALYVSPRNGRQLDVTAPLASRCSSTAISCAVSCNNELAGDPDVGQRKYCEITYRCGGGATQEFRIEEGETRALTCTALGSIAGATEADRLATLVHQGSIKQLAAYLATPGADINARPNVGPTNVDKALLDYAAEQNQVAVATWLLDHGANVDAANHQGRHLGLTALHRAVFGESFEVAQLLIARGADVNANRSRGATPLLYAVSLGHRRIVELLLQHGADVKASAGVGPTVVSVAAERGDLDIVTLLEAHGAALDDDRALPAAAFNQHPDVVRYLLAHNQSQSVKDTALRFAVIAANSRNDTASLDLVSMLIAAGANVNNTVNAAPNTPVMMAGRPELRELLIAHGALEFAAVQGQSNGAVVNGPTASAPGVVSPEVLALARIVRGLGGEDQRQSFDIFAALRMRMIAPDDPGWNRSNPRWMALFNTVKQDLQRDLEPALQASGTKALGDLAAALESHLAAGEVGQLLAFYRSDKGQRYSAFQQRVGAIQAQGISQLTVGLVGAGAIPSARDAPSKERLDARRRVLGDSWISLMVPDALSSLPGRGAQMSDPKSFLSSMSDVIAKTHGPELDALEQEYASDLSQFEAFHQSPAARSLLSAMRAAMQQAAARPQSSDPFKVALERSIAQHAPSWRAAYEAGRSSAASPDAKSSRLAGTAPPAPTTPASASAANIHENVQIEQQGRVTSVTVPGQLAPTRTFGCVGLEKVDSTATPPDLYSAGRACVEQGDYDDAARLFLLGGAYGRFDAARVTDKTAGQGLTILIMGFGNGLREDQKQAFLAATSRFHAAADRERLCGQFKRLGPPNYFPRYMVLHGIKAFTAADPTADALDPNFDAAATWQQILTQGLSCAADRH